MTSQLGDCSDVGVDCDESVIKVQGLINTFEKLMADKSDVLLKIPPPLPVRHRVLPPVPPRNIVKYPDPLSESDDSFDSSDEDIPPPKGLPPILNWNNLPSLNLIEFPDPPSGDSFESSDDDETKDLSTVPTLDPFPTIPSDSEDSFNSFNPHYSTKLHNIIQEIIEKEESYVDCLETGMLNYMSALDTNELPLSLRGQKYRIFGNIQNLYEFHKTIFLPQLIKCSNDVEQLTELFTTFMQRDSFYGYVLYALNRRKSELLCNEHVYFFRLIQNVCGDKLGINNFLLRPIQQLPKYKLLLNEMIKELSCDGELYKHEITVACVAENEVLRMLDMVNESMNINQIKNCNEIDIMKQGKFKKLSEFLIYDWEQRRRYKGKLLFFERSIIYCEIFERKGLEFRGYYLKEVLGISYVEGKAKFKLYEGKRGKKEIILTGELTLIQDNIMFINTMLLNKGQQESKLKRSQSSRSMESIRNSIMSISSGLSNFSFQSSSSSGTGSYDLKERF